MDMSRCVAFGAKMDCAKTDCVKTDVVTVAAHSAITATGAINLSRTALTESGPIYSAASG
jgi:hypothetical protein